MKSITVIVSYLTSSRTMERFYASLTHMYLFHASSQVVTYRWLCFALVFEVGGTLLGSNNLSNMTNLPRLIRCRKLLGRGGHRKWILGSSLEGGVSCVCSGVACACVCEWWPLEELDDRDEVEEAEEEEEGDEL